MIVIKGNNLARPAPDNQQFPLPSQLAGTTVKATVNGTAVEAYMIYTSTRRLRRFCRRKLQKVPALLRSHITARPARRLQFVWCVPLSEFSR